MKIQTEDHMKMGTEVGVMDLPAEECQGLQMVTGSLESAREPTSLTHFLGTHGVSLWECGDGVES